VDWDWAAEATTLAPKNRFSSDSASRVLLSTDKRFLSRA
jgi:hypothetical protein